MERAVPEVKMPNATASNHQIASPPVTCQLFSNREENQRRRNLESTPLPSLRLRRSRRMPGGLGSVAEAELYQRVRHEISNRFGAVQLVINVLFECAGKAHGVWLNHLQSSLLAVSTSVDNALLLHHAPILDRRPKLLNELLRDIPLLLCELRGAHNVNIQVALDPDSTMVDADLRSLQQVIANLALNAVQAMPSGGEFRVSTNRCAGRVMLRFSDTGGGIPDEILDNIFEVGSSTRAGSAGLGLAACRLLLELQGGCISIESTSSAGTCIRIELPEAQR